MGIEVWLRRFTGRDGREHLCEGSRSTWFCSCGTFGRDGVAGWAGHEARLVRVEPVTSVPCWLTSRFR